MTSALPVAADPEYLTGALHRSGVPAAVRVREASVESDRTTILSRIVRLRLVCDGGGAPRLVVLKTGLPGRSGGGLKEVEFYARVAAAMPPGLVPRCFAAHHDASRGDWHLLLEDLTETHVIGTSWPLPPSAEQCCRIVDAWARFHAAWWDDPRLGCSIGTQLDAARFAPVLHDFAARFARFADRFGDALPGEHRTLYERFIAAWPQRRRWDHNVTLVHGDAHCWNVFLPRDGGDDLRLFDWDAWRIGIAATDLAYMMAVHWYPDRRRNLEHALLDRYHATLLGHGVRGYDRQALAEDYRLAVLMQLATPIWQASYDIPPVIWWNNLERVMLAVDDLGCRDLLS
ncbi:MAG TPA: phosphotransferase [Acetobacteraceae bacterium]|nr:phosphotransferase [Acetobacteraceae bacterium]